MDLIKNLIFFFFPCCSISSELEHWETRWYPVSTGWGICIRKRNVPASHHPPCMLWIVPILLYKVSEDGNLWVNSLYRPLQYYSSFFSKIWSFFVCPLPALSESTFVVCPMLLVFQVLRFTRSVHCFNQPLKEPNDLGQFKETAAAPEWANFSFLFSIPIWLSRMIFTYILLLLLLLI